MKADSSWTMGQPLEEAIAQDGASPGEKLCALGDGTVLSKSIEA